MNVATSKFAWWMDSIDFGEGGGLIWWHVADFKVSSLGFVASSVGGSRSEYSSLFICAFCTRPFFRKVILQWLLFYEGSALPCRIVNKIGCHQVWGYPHAAQVRSLSLFLVICPQRVVISPKSFTSLILGLEELLWMLAGRESSWLCLSSAMEACRWSGMLDKCRMVVVTI